MNEADTQTQEFSEEQLRQLWQELEAVVSHADESGESQREEIGDCCVQLGVLANLLDGDPLAAEYYFTRAIGIYDVTLAATDVRRLRPMCELAMTKMQLGEPEEVRRWLERTHELLRVLPSETVDADPSLAAQLQSLEGFVLRADEYFEKAAVCFERACCEAAKFLDPADPEWVQYWSNLAMSRQDLDDHAGARELLRRAIERIKDSFGPDHPDLPSFLAGLATSEHLLGNDAEARQLFEQVLAEEQESGGEGDPNVALAHHNLAEVELAAGNSEAAIEHSRSAFRIFFDLDHELAQEELTWLAQNDPGFAEFIRDLREQLVAEEKGDDDVDGEYDEDEYDDGAEEDGMETLR